MPPKKPAPTELTKSLEKSFWEAATNLQGTFESSDWSGATEALRNYGEMSINKKRNGGALQRFVENNLVDCGLTIQLNSAV